jgi:hypothetical protein
MFETCFEIFQNLSPLSLCPEQQKIKEKHISKKKEKEKKRSPNSPSSQPEAHHLFLLSASTVRQQSHRCHVHHLGDGTAVGIFCLL